MRLPRRLGAPPGPRSPIEGSPLRTRGSPRCAPRPARRPANPPSSVSSPTIMPTPMREGRRDPATRCPSGVRDRLGTVAGVGADPPLEQWLARPLSPEEAQAIVLSLSQWDYHRPDAQNIKASSIKVKRYEPAFRRGIGIARRARSAGSGSPQSFATTPAIRSSLTWV
jgi:hypothetical protein